MRLRNKKTGQEGNFIINNDHFECVDLDYVPLYFSLSGLLDEWEDYEDYAPKEPLTKSEKQIIKEALMALLGQGKLVGFDLSGECQRIIDKLDKEGEE